jgi:Uma2 family endonuclease
MTVRNAAAVAIEGDEAYPDEVAREGSIGPMSEAEYLEYDRTHDGKHERVGGEVFAMSGVSPAHNRIEVNTIVALGSRLRGAPCQVNGSNLRVRLDDNDGYCYPDVSIVCGKAEFAPARPPTLLNPRVIIEIVSKSTEDHDRGAKAAHYRRRPTVELVLLIDSRRLHVERQSRNSDGSWTLTEHTSGAVRVLDFDVPLDELYATVDFDAAR